VFLPSLRNSFWTDDFGWVSRAMDAWGDPARWFTLAKSDFRPLAGLTFLLNLALSGIAPAGYHAFNVLLHLADVALVMALCRRVSGSPVAAGLAGLLFAGGFGHYGDAVIWISGRTGPLADVFVLGALLFHWDALERGRVRDRVVSVGCFALALLAKETAIIALPLLLLLEWAHGPFHRPEASARTRLLAYAPYAVLLAGWLAVQLAVVRAGSDIVGRDYAFGPHAAGHMVEYLARMFVPIVPSSSLVAAPGGVRPLLAVLLPALEVAVPLFWLLVLLRPGTARAVRFGVLWMPIALLPVVFLTFRPITRYLYEPAIGLAIVAGTCGAAAWERMAARPWRTLARGGALCALVALLALEAAVIQVVIRRHRLEERAQDPAAFVDLAAKARRLGFH